MALYLMTGVCQCPPAKSSATRMEAGLSMQTGQRWFADDDNYSYRNFDW